MNQSKTEYFIRNLISTGIMFLLWLLTRHTWSFYLAMGNVVGAVLFWVFRQVWMKQNGRGHAADTKAV